MDDEDFGDEDYEEDFEEVGDIGDGYGVYKDAGWKGICTTAMKGLPSGKGARIRKSVASSVILPPAVKNKLPDRSFEQEEDEEFEEADEYETYETEEEPETESPSYSVFIKEDGTRILLDKEGEPVEETGWIRWNNSAYYLEEGGKIRISSWVKDKTGTYYVDKSGKKVVGWKTIKGKRYYFDLKSGVMAKGITTIREKKYYFGKNGALQMKGTVKSGSRIYRIRRDGSLFNA